MLISQRLDPTPKLQVGCHDNFPSFTNRVEHPKMEDFAQGDDENQEMGYTR
jgi:hypothetical protein